MSSEANSLLAKDELTDVELSRLNRLIIQDIIPGFRKLPKDEQFREYFILGIDYTVEDLDWPGEAASGSSNIYVPWLGAEKTLLNPSLSPEDPAYLDHQRYLYLFEEITNFAGPVVNPEVAFGQGATVENVIAQASSGVKNPALFIPLEMMAGGSQIMSDTYRQTEAVQNIGGVDMLLYTQQSYGDLYAVLTDKVFQEGSEYKVWEDLTDTERANAIMDFLGYEKLFDVQFLSGFEGVVSVTVPISVVQTPSVLSLFEGKNRAEVVALGAQATQNAGFAFLADASFQLNLSGATTILKTVDVGLETEAYAFEDAYAPDVQGLLYEVEGGDTQFIPGLFANNKFMATPFDMVEGIDFQVIEYEVNKTYFDFWFSEFEPFDPDLHWNQALHATEKEAARAHFLPPNEMLTDAYESITFTELENALHAIDPDKDVPPDLFVDGTLALSDEYAEEFAAIVGSNYAFDGEYMSKELAQAIRTVIGDAVDEIADQFFIAGVDYNENYSNPEKAEYIASFFEREDQILTDTGFWKVYSASEGLGRINRNIEGIPTANFWDLDFTGVDRDVVSYTLDDGTKIFLRVPVEWWENYTVETLGNDRTEEDVKTLQYVGKVNT